MSEDMFDVFRGTVKANYLDDNVIDLIHERYMVLVHIDENARSTIHAALQRAWVQKTATALHSRNSSAHEFPLLFPNRSVLNRLCTALELTLR